MDDLKQAWGELKEQSADFSNPTDEEILETIRSRSSGVIEKLHRNVRIKFYFAVGFTLLFGIIIPFAVPLASQILLIILWCGYLVGSMLLYQELQILKKGIDMSQDLLHGMQAYHQRIKRVLHHEEIGGLSFYPVSASAGFFLGMQITAPDVQIMTRTMDWVILVVMLTALTIGGHYATRWLNKLSFGKYLKQLEDNIRELKEGV